MSSHSRTFLLNIMMEQVIKNSTYRRKFLFLLNNATVGDPTCTAHHILYIFKYTDMNRVNIVGTALHNMCFHMVV